MPANPQVTDEMVQRALNAQWPGKECVYADEHPSAEAGMRAALEAALADHVMVPREPTEAMLKAGFRTLGWTSNTEGARQDATSVYLAMIGAV